MGSAGAKIAAVITGEVDAYVHAGGQYEWDSAAPVAVATGHGSARFPDRRIRVGIQPSPIRSCRTCWSAARIWPDGSLRRCNHCCLT